MKHTFYHAVMGLNIKNLEVERLAAEVARLAGETKTEAIRRALIERRERLSYRGAGNDPKARAMAFLKKEVWARVPKTQQGQRPDAAEEAEILGYGPEGI
jgi:antitoxin VapB